MRKIKQADWQEWGGRGRKDTIIQNGLGRLPWGGNTRAETNAEKKPILQSCRAILSNRVASGLATCGYWTLEMWLVQTETGCVKYILDFEGLVKKKEYLINNFYVMLK